MKLPATLSQIESTMRELSGLRGEAWRSLDAKIYGGSNLRKIGSIAAPDRATPDDLVFLAKADLLADLLNRGVCCFVLPVAVVEMIDSGQFTLHANCAYLRVKDTSLALALIKQLFADATPQPFVALGEIHPTAIIDPLAQIAPNTTIGPFAVVAARAKIGADTIIYPHVVVETEAIIGERVTIHPHVVIGHHCAIGDDTIIKAQSVIGSDGFGFAQDSQRRSHRIPQTGRVVIGERVVVGACCVVDRATFDETRIADGVIMDNFCHIAHNVSIGDDSILTAGFIVAGSTKIGKRMIASGQTGILDHLHIADDVVLLQRAGVTEDIVAPGYYAGLPARPLGEYQRGIAMQKKLGDMRKKINDLEKAVANLLEDKIK